MNVCVALARRRLWRRCQFPALAPGPGLAQADNGPLWTTLKVSKVFKAPKTRPRTRRAGTATTTVLGQHAAQGGSLNLGRSNSPDLADRHPPPTLAHGTK